MKLNKTYDTVFLVRWNAERRSFDVLRDGIPTGTFAHDRQSAISLASRTARFETREGRTAAVFSINADGKQQVEWSS